MFRGQISIDLILTCIFAVVFVSAGSLIFFNISNFKENQTEISLRHQLKLISSDVADFIIVSKTFDSTDIRELSLKKKVNLVNYDGKLLSPSLSIDNNDVIANINVGGVDINEKSYYGDTSLSISFSDDLVSVIK
jgi:uncharacterized protein (UPF0333 family)